LGRTPLSTIGGVHALGSIAIRQRHTTETLGASRAIRRSAEVLTARPALKQVKIDHGAGLASGKRSRTRYKHSPVKTGVLA
jgi:hypothetical protein